jgi:ActR/RegA family two-component response regulator
MGIPLLVATPHTSFGELIRQSLEETGLYKVRIVDSRAGALSALKQEEFQRVFLDFDLGPNVVVGIGQALRKASPDILLTIILGEEDLPESLDEIKPWTVLHKPFYLPDLLRMLGENVDESQEKKQIATATPEVDEVSWLDDVDKAAQHLTRLTLESSAQAALITRQNTLWAYAGGLSQEAANEIVLAIARYWDAQKESDLLRFIRLEATRAEHMLYATRLNTGVIMAMVFDAETPFSTIRSQANRLAQSLSISDSNQQPERLPAPKNC